MLSDAKQIDTKTKEVSREKYDVIRGKFVSYSLIQTREVKKTQNETAPPAAPNAEQNEQNEQNINPIKSH